MDARTLHAYAGTNRVYTVVVAFYGHFGALAWLADNLANADKIIEHFWHLLLEKPLEEHRASAADDDAWRTI